MDPAAFVRDLLPRLSPERLLARHAARIDALPRPLHVACLGKPAHAYARVLASRAAAILAIGPEDGDHPVPGDRSLAAGEKLRAFVQAIPSDATFLFVVAGGGSALAECPRAPYTMDTIAAETVRLLHAGASIQELNEARSAMSALKKGGLGRECRAQRTVVLVLSDVPVPDLSLVASGPVLDGELVRLGGYPELAAAAAQLLPGYAIDLAPALDMGMDDGIAFHLDWARANTRSAPWALISGGELPVRVQGTGRGGRNSEFVVRMAAALRDEPGNWRVLSFATDGVDGNTDAAGGWIDAGTLDRDAAEAAIAASDTATLLEDNGTAFRTGRTDTNLMDLRILLRDL